MSHPPEGVCGIPSTIIEYYKIDDPNKTILKEISYTSDKIILEEKNFNSNGDLDGKQIKYHLDCVHGIFYYIESFENYKDGLLDGEVYNRGPHGYNQHINYKNGKLNGEFYRALSGLTEKGQYKDGEKIELWQYRFDDLYSNIIEVLYDENGNIIEAIKYYDKWNSSGKLIVDENFTNMIQIKVSFINGEYEVYDDSGNIESTGLYDISKLPNNKGELKYPLHEFFYNVSKRF